MNRPLVWAAAVLAAGIYAASAGRCPGIAAPVVLFLLAISILFWPRRWPFRDECLVGLAFFAAGALAWNLRPTDPRGDALSQYSIAHPGAVYSLEGRVRETQIIFPGEDYAQFLLDVDQAVVKNIPMQVSGGVSVRWTQPAFPVYCGDRIRVTGFLSQYLSPVNHGSSGIETYLRLRKVFSTTSVRGGDVQKIQSGSWSLFYWTSRLQMAGAQTLRNIVPEYAFPFIMAVWLGDRGQYNQPQAQRFIDTGTAHILSVSGLHVAIIYASVAAFLRLIKIPPRGRAVIGIIAVFAFALIAGGRVASLRSAAMVAVFLTYDFFHREPDAPTALSLAALIFLAIHPPSLFDAGFLLSFSSVASILVFSTWRIPVLDRLPWWISGALKITLGVQVIPLPLAIYYFHVLPIASPLANLIIVPLLTITMWMCFTATGLALVFPPAAQLFGQTIGMLVLAMQKTADGVAAIPFSHVPITSPSSLSILAYWAAAVCLLQALKRPKPKRWIVAAASFCCIAWAFWRPWNPPPVVDFLDVGHADTTFIRTPGGTTVLIDGGDRNEYSDAGERIVNPFLYGNGVTRLDYVIATHPESDHMGGLLSILEKFPVRTAVLGPVPTDRKLEQEFLRRCAEKGIRVIRIAAGDRLPVADAQLEVLHPTAKIADENPNQDALVLRLSWPGVSVLFAADIEKDAEAAVAQYDCRAAVLKVPHHGSATSSSPEFLDAVRPAAAVFSTRATQRRDAVGKGILDRYRNRGIMIQRTDYQGGIRMKLSHGVWSMEGARGKRGYSLEPIPELSADATPAR